MQICAMSDLYNLTATQAAAQIAKGTISAQDFTRACLDRIAAVEPEVQAFVHLDPDYALKQAKALDEHRAAGRPLGPLHGIPVALKDIIDTADYPTECGCGALAGRKPAQDATIVRRLREAGAVIIGKTVTTELAYFHPGKTRNPHDTGRTPGGSSSGSAAAVAARMVPLAVGSQTNGSLIRPGSFCGIYVTKATHGLVSRGGILTLSHVLDHIGPYARSLDDIALMLDVMAGYDPADPDTRPMATLRFREVAAEDFPVAPRFAFVRTPAWDKADVSTQAAFEAFVASLGEHCVAVDLSDAFARYWEAHRAIMSADMTHRLGALSDRGGAGISQAFRDLVAEGRQVTATRYLAALDQAKEMAAALDVIFRDYDAIITPASVGVAPKGLQSTGNPIFCSIWTMTGVPSLSLPLLNSDDNMPLGVQLVGARGDDGRLLRHARWLVREAGKKNPAA